MPRLLKERSLLIVACGRSGTLYVCRLFRKIGIDLGHEHVGKFGCCSMYFVPNHSDFSIVNHGQKVPIHKGESKQDFKFEHIWHQVRHPLPTIDSLAKAFTQKVRLWTHEALGVPLPGTSGKRRCKMEDKIHWAMHYWVINNRLCEAQSEWTYRLEAIPWEQMLDRIGIEQIPIPDVSTTTNRSLRFAMRSKAQVKEIKKHIHDTQWNTLRRINRDLAEEIKEMAVAYGYKN